jgi:regulatory protein
VIIAALRRQRARRVELLLDIDASLTISASLAEERGLRVGQSITQRELADLQEEDARRGAFDAGLRLLAYRPRSQGELRTRLRRKGVPPAAVDDAVQRLQELGYLDDAAFARFYTESQQAARPRARWVLARELKAKGVATETAARATEDADDEQAAYDAATRRARTLRENEYARYRERLGAFLTRRGFSYDVARRTVDRCWSEGRGDPADAMAGEGAIEALDL